MPQEELILDMTGLDPEDAEFIKKPNEIYDNLVHSMSQELRMACATILANMALIKRAQPELKRLRADVHIHIETWRRLRDRIKDLDPATKKPMQRELQRFEENLKALAALKADALGSSDISPELLAGLPQAESSSTDNGKVPDRNPDQDSPQSTDFLGQ